VVLVQKCVQEGQSRCISCAWISNDQAYSGIQAPPRILSRGRVLHERAYQPQPHAIDDLRAVRPVAYQQRDVVHESVDERTGVLVDRELIFTNHRIQPIPPYVDGA
jgi:hypothetical protein